MKWCFIFSTKENSRFTVPLFTKCSLNFCQFIFILSFCLLLVRTPVVVSSKSETQQEEGTCDGSLGKDGNSESDSCTRQVEPDDFFDCPKRSETKKFICKGAVDASIKFFLYTKKVPYPYPLELGNIESLITSSFLKGKQVKVLIHGYFTTSKGPFVEKIKTAYLNPLNNDVGDLNVIVVDWGELSNSFPYYKSADCVPTVAQKVHRLIECLIEHDYVTLDKVHFIGHSLGAHISGMACSALGRECGRISGLEPARPCFRKGEVTDEYRLDYLDAKFVDVIHTDGSTGKNGGFGLHFPMGDVDFYPNGGLRPQPNCKTRKKRNTGTDDLFDSCHHSTSHELFAESINKNVGVFWARECTDWECFKRGQCNEKPQVLMGEHTPVLTKEEGRRNYYLRTGDKKPFALGKIGSTQS